ncbi:MAG: GNAT family N-acetyltransferase [Actinobacteria bacterium]|nr:GNAT family N-acetyltransferase [Actinomycetota bacterium]
MYFRLRGSEFSAGTRDRGRGNREAMRGIVADGGEPGLLAYRDGEPVGWVSVAPREQLGRIERSPTTRPIDDRPVWSVVCFYIHRSHRSSGVGTELLRAAVDHARDRGARIVEGYPYDPGRRVPNSEAYYGLPSMFEAAGFAEVARRSPTRPIMRRGVRPRRPRP